MRRWRLYLLLASVLLTGAGAGIGTGWSAGEPAAADSGIDSVEKRRILFSLQQERERLQAEYARKEKNMQMREIALKTLQGEVDKKLSDLQQLQQKLERLLVLKDQAEENRVKGLSKMYEKMEAAKGARLLAALDQDLAVAILAGMKTKSAGGILGNMAAEDAARLSAAYSSLDPR